MIHLVGIDCASAPTNVGLAFGTFSEGRVVVTDVELGSRAIPPADRIARFLATIRGPALLAMDAPLGWPAELATQLADHQAGDGLQGTANALFRRQTDVFVWQQVGKKPLDVGADLIARTAHAALSLLHAVRADREIGIPLAWNPAIVDCRAIEVYPGATLAAHGISGKGYKAKGGVAERLRVLEQVAERLELHAEVPGIETGSDALDAIICLLAAQDFLAGHCMPPPDDARTRKEGWIWVRRPDRETSVTGDLLNVTRGS